MSLKVKIFFFSLSLFFLSTELCARNPSLESLAVSYVKRIDKSSKDLSLFATEIYNLRLITSNRIFKVSTADTIPFRRWFVVIDDTGKASKYSHTRIKEFNSFIKSESLKLRTKKDFRAFIDVFVTLATDSQDIIGEDFPVDKSRIKNEYKRISIKSRITKNRKGFYRLVFFTADPTGSITMWRLILNGKGVVKTVKYTKITFD